MKKSIFQSFALLMLFLFALPAYGAQGDDPREKGPGEFKPSTTVTQQYAPQTGAAPEIPVAADRASRTAGEKKLSTDLLTLIRPELLPQGKTLQNLKDDLQALKQLVPQGADARIRSAAAPAPADVVYVYVHLQQDASIHAVDDFLWKITDCDEKNKIVVAYVEVSRIASLAGQAAVATVSTVMPPLVNKVNTSEGDVIHRSDLVRALANGSGAGIKIGVISDGANTRSVAQATGDLPADGAGLTVLSDTVGGDEGTAMLEIVYDLAPSAQLYFHDCGANTVAFNSAIDALVAAGCKVIVDDIGWLTEPFFEQGTVGGHVAAVLAAHDIIYISSAGNAGAKHHQKTYTASTGGFTTHNIAYYPDWHNFNISNGTNMYIQMPANSNVKVILEWNEAFGAAVNDFDLFLHQVPATTDNVYLAKSDTTQASTHNPLEALSYTNTTGSTMDVQVSIARYSGSTSAIMEVYVYTSGGAGVYTNNIVVQDSIFGHPAVPSVIAAGAIAANDPGNNDIESFSSQGPVTLLAGSVQKPDVCGIDGVSVTGAGGFSNPFYGTSAAAPHIAAIAAQLWGKNASLNRDQIKSYLLNNTIDLGSAGFDAVFGNGRADAYNAFLAVPAGTGSTTTVPATTPNLAPYQPAAWSDKLVVASTTGTNADDVDLTTKDTLYVDWAALNDSTQDISTRFYSSLLVDNVEVANWYADSLQSQQYTYVEDYSLGKLSAGTHTISVSVDSTNTIAESSESDNIYEKSIVVTRKRCLAIQVLGENNPKLEQLRYFRDSRLAQSAVGRIIISMYYNNADSINAALERSPALSAVTRRALEAIASMVGKKEN